MWPRNRRIGNRGGSAIRSVGAPAFWPALLVTVTSVAAAQKPATPVDPESGLVKDEAGTWKVARDRCTECHSATLLSQNRTSRDGWIRTIRRMEKEEGLEPLGDLEKPILDYLAATYGVQVKPTELRRRRAPLRQPPVADGG
ncbi:MAG: hypothetical protein F4060_00995 [Holophagales bacterium]|nr:hypothetical protein [Holophagales bacterium]MYG32337.1 hypothetical protein [Holophagales bacterium]MYI78494.1 hypothetical protein [Holophagales bacterium]